MILLIVKLLLAHLLGDFVFQPYSWVKSKEKKKINLPLPTHSDSCNSLIRTTWD